MSISASRAGRNRRRTAWIGSAALLLALAAAAPGLAEPPDPGEECTIALIGGAATADGRPILWKNRDAGFLDNEIAYFDDGPYSYVTLINAGDAVNAWVGVNETGFAILNALSYNLPDTLWGGITNGRLMKLALQTCATVSNFQQLLVETNKSGRENPANLAVMDAAGSGAVFEVGNRAFVRFDVGDASAAPSGYLVRTNFSLSGDTSGVGTARYHRCRRLVDAGVRGGEASVAWILSRVARDLWSPWAEPYPLPFEGAPPGYPKALGYVETSDTINRRSTVAAAAILGVLPGEDPILSTFYGMFGQPVVAIPVPVWVAAGTTPPQLDGETTAPLCDLARQRGSEIYDYAYNASLLNTFKIVNNSRLGYLTQAERIQRWVMSETDRALAHWREVGAGAEEMASVEGRIAEAATGAYQDGRLTRAPSVVHLTTTPNPTRAGATISVAFLQPPPPAWSIDIFDIRGRRIRRIEPDGWGSRKEGLLPWDGLDGTGRPVASGTYFYRPSWPTASGGTITVLR